MRAVVYNRFWHSMGGGERHAGMIAQVMSRWGDIEVDLLGHTKVDRDELASRLGLDLSATTMRVVPDLGEHRITQLSAEYDLFVNASYMSRVVPESPRSAYLCFFPTPFDHDLSAWRRSALRFAGPRVRSLRETLSLGFGTGWFPPEGGRRRKWTWTNGEGVLTLESGDRRDLRVDLGRPGAPGPATLRIEDAEGNEVAEITVTVEFRQHLLRFPATPTGQQLHLRSDTFTPGQHDPRSLGVAMSRPRLLGTHLGVWGRAAMRLPWLLRDPHDLSFVNAYDVVLANSEYTRSWIQRLWNTDSDVLFPPIEVQRMRPSPEREKTILTVGRFFAPGHGHSKRQLEMVRMFGGIVRSGRLAGWTLHVVGGCEDSQRQYLHRVRAAAAGLPVEVHANAPRALVERLMSTASIFWSATGYGENTERRPWTNEHFGMTTAEAMAGGCVPVVIDRAGQREIVRPGVDGYRWSTQQQLVEQTIQVAEDEALRARLAASAIERARVFSDERFATRWADIADAHCLLKPRT